MCVCIVPVSVLDCFSCCLHVGLVHMVRCTSRRVGEQEVVPLHPLPPPWFKVTGSTDTIAFGFLRERVEVLLVC